MVECTRGVLPSEGAECAVPIPGPGPGPVPDPGPVPVSCHVVSCIFNWTRYTSPPLWRDVMDLVLVHMMASYMNLM